LSVCGVRQQFTLDIVRRLMAQVIYQRHYHA